MSTPDRHQYRRLPPGQALQNAAPCTQHKRLLVLTLIAASQQVCPAIPGAAPPLYFLHQIQAAFPQREANAPLLLSQADTVVEATMQITSTAFADNASIPPRHTCDGKDVSPALRFSAVPSQAKSLVLIVDDPDAPDPAAPKMTWVHWVLYNLPPSTAGLEEGVKSGELPAGTREGLNDWKRLGYGGPCPPVGRHRYFHKLYALDTVLPDLGRATKADVERAMKGHVIAEAQLVGTYQH